MSELLRMEHISKRFGSFYANKDISLTVNRGEVLTLLGENCINPPRVRSFWRARRFASSRPVRR